MENVRYCGALVGLFLSLMILFSATWNGLVAFKNSLSSCMKACLVKLEGTL